MLLVNGKEYICNANYTTKQDIASLLKLSTSEFYLLCNGKIITEVLNLQTCRVEVILRITGGKGGFGSMLRAIGAQIEKTTNREACRDLSGRRLRDINEEKRLKAWISQQADRERETEDRRKKKLERLCQKPKHEFRDDNYERERNELTDRVEDALEHGLHMDKGKRKSTEVTTTDKKKKPRLWLGSDEELSTSDDDFENNDECSTSKPSISKIADSSCSTSINIIDSSENTEEEEQKNLNSTNETDLKESEVKETLEESKETVTDDIQEEEKEK